MAQKIKRHFLRTFGFAAILLMVFSSVVPGMISKIQVAHAAGAGTALISTGTSGANAGATSFGTPAAAGSVTVGQKTYVKIDLTVGALGIAAAQNNVTVQINDNLFPLSSWAVGKSAATTDLDTVGKWTVTYEDTDNVTHNNGSILFTASGATNVGLITIQADEIMDPTDIIHIYGVVQDDNKLLALADVVIQTDDAGASPTAIASPPQIATSAADAAATVDKATPTSGSTGALTLTFTVPRTLVATDKINITFPTGFYTVAATTANIASTDVLCSAGGGNTLDVTAPGSNVLTLTVAGGKTMTTGMIGCTVVIPGVDAIPQYVASTDITTFTVQTSLGVNIATDTDVALTNTITEGALTSTNVQPASLVAGATPTDTITFTTTTPIPNAGKIVVTYPSGFAPAGADGLTAGGLSGLDGVWTASVSGLVVTFTQVGGGISVAGAKSFTIAGVRNPQVTGSAGTYTITTKIAAGSNIDKNAAVTADIITAGALSSTNVEPDSLVVGSSAVNTITFTTANPITNLGKIVVTYPSGFSVAGANGVVATNLSGLDGVWTATTSGQVVTLTQTGGTQSTAGAKSLRIANIVTPGTPGSTGTYTITTTTTGDVNIDTDAAVAADTVVSGSSSSDSGGGGGVVGDTTPPTNVSVAIVGAPKVPTSNVQLTLAATGATEMLISNVSDFGSASWETYNTVKNWTLLSGTGAKSVYVKFRDAAHNVSAVAQANITVEASAPAPGVVPVPVVPVVQQPTPGVSFLDVATHWAKDYIVQLSQMGVVTGRTATSYEPDGLLTRAEMVKIALLTFGYKIDITNTKSFSDVGATEWFAPYITLAKAQGIVGGYNDGTFHPNNPITRVEALKILLIAAKKNVTGAAAAPFVDVNQAAWYAQYVNYAFAKAVVSGKDATHFHPADFITRGEMAKIAILTFQVK